MKRYLIATHGHMASGIKDSIRILTGMESSLVAVDAYTNAVDVQDEVNRFIAQLHGNTGIIFTDIVGGSVVQKVLAITACMPGLQVLTGVNLPIVLSVIMEPAVPTTNRLNQLIQQSQVQLASVPVELNKITENDPDAFFDEG